MGIINKSAIRKETSFSISLEFEQEFENKVKQLIKQAETRATKNNRRTLFERDL